MAPEPPPDKVRFFDFATQPVVLLLE